MARARGFLRTAGAGVVVPLVLLAGPAFGAPPAGSRLVIAPAPQGEALSKDYSLEVNGRPVPIYTARVNEAPFDFLDHGGAYSFASFDFSGRVTLKIRSARVLQTARIRPLSKGIRHSLVDWHTTIVNLDRPCLFSFEPRGKRSPLLIFANALETGVPKPGDANVIYFGPGVHRPAGGIVEVKSNQTLYIAGGAVVEAAVVVRDAENATIRGRGIVCGNAWPHNKGPAKYLVNVLGSKRVTLEGVVLRGAYWWTVGAENSEHLEIANVKICGGRLFNDDGIDPINSRHVLVRDCFIRTDDDCIAVKAERREWGEVDDIRVERSVLWCDRALIVRLACESQARFMQNLVFRDLDVIHFVATAFNLMPGEDLTIQNVRFEDIRIEANGQGQLVEIRAASECASPMMLGHVRNVLFKDIRLTGDPGEYKITLEGRGDDHQVQGVTIENLSINGRPLTKDSTSLQVGKWVTGLSVAAGSPAAR